ncbi:putative major capsid protein [Aquamicrobium phage P14]|uniref:Putative major capsid protein n=1 Tax=Aquamicrobium phage P14 TaxID=1927013 RepID=A0A1L5C069_9CAUD|nr:putative major capsid protein [Aquamicrobium phage P14]APL99495.1 putative major capsid protein [Aquamicrobium phage P14]
MSLLDTTPIRPNQQNQTGSTYALAIERFTGVVEGTIERASKLAPHIKFQTIKGTDTLTNKGIGEVDLQVLKPGEAPDGTGADISKATVTVETVTIARNILPALETLQTDFNVAQELGLEHGKKHAKFTDQAAFIAAIKTALLTDSAYSNGASGKPKGHFGGNRKVLASSSDVTDPAALYAAIADLITAFQEKDVDPSVDGVVLAFRPREYNILMQAEQIINGQYHTADGTKQEGMIFKAFGCPVINSNNIPNTVITGHELSTTRNGNFFDGDFTKTVAVALTPRALLAGASITLQTKVWVNDLDKQTYVDSWQAFGLASNRAEYAGVILLP